MSFLITPLDILQSKMIGNTIIMYDQNTPNDVVGSRNFSPAPPLNSTTASHHKIVNVELAKLVLVDGEGFDFALEIEDKTISEGIFGFSSYTLIQMADD